MATAAGRMAAMAILRRIRLAIHQAIPTDHNNEETVAVRQQETGDGNNRNTSAMFAAAIVTRAVAKSAS